MKIGNGALELGIIGIEIPTPELEKLAKDTLDIYPLEYIFNVAEIHESINTYFDYPKSEIEKEIRKRNELKRKLTLISIIEEYCLKEEINIYGSDGIVYSIPNPSAFVHELSHALGLQHPLGESCNPDKCDEEQERVCPYFKNLMCPASAENNFSPENIKKLEKWYLK